MKTIAAYTPPKDWNVAGFDDTGWALHRGAIKPEEFREPAGRSLLLLHARFQVNDLVAGRDLGLDLSCRGGVIVYLNGTEVARGNMPAGFADAGTLAEANTTEASLFPEGHAFAGKVFPEGALSAKEFSRQTALRDRHLDGVKIPGALLRNWDAGRFDRDARLLALAGDVAAATGNGK